MLERRRGGFAYICDVCYAQLATHATKPDKAQAMLESEGWLCRSTSEGEPLHYCRECRSVASPGVRPLAS